MIKINEIFYSIQGEAKFSGMPCIFIRLTGCNLRCSYCDTKYSYYEGRFFEIEEILKEIKKYNCNIVEITGGEPMFQKDTPKLAEALLDLDYIVLIETNGSFDISLLPKKTIKILDIKCPSSGEVTKNFLDNLELLEKKDQIKFIISDRKDYEFSKNILKFHNIKVEDGNIFFHCNYNILKLEDLADWILKDNLNVRLGIQIHKLIWGDKRGV